VDDTVLSIDLVGGAGEELARRFLAHNIFLTGGLGSDLVGGVGLTEAELEGGVSRVRVAGRKRVLRQKWERRGREDCTYLLQLQRSLDLGYILIDPALEGLKVNGLSYFACHGVYGAVPITSA
jgi:hypothetical protein